MDARELRDLQRPLKERYRSEPERALVTSEAVGRPGEGITCSVAAGTSERVAGLHPATGGDGSRACSADMLLEALVACAGVTLSSVATHLGVELRDAVVRARGRWDARGTLGVSPEAPVGITDVELEFDLDTDADEETLAKLLELTERYCVIYQTLKSPPSVRTTVA